MEKATPTGIASRQTSPGARVALQRCTILRVSKSIFSLTVNLETHSVYTVHATFPHKVAGIVEAVEAVGASVLFLLPYSPDFNPIELMW